MQQHVDRALRAVTIERKPVVVERLVVLFWKNNCCQRFFRSFSVKCVFLFHVQWKLSLFLWKTITHQNGLLIFLGKETHSETKSFSSFFTIFFRFFFLHFFICSFFSFFHFSILFFFNFFIFFHFLSFSFIFFSFSLSLLGAQNLFLFEPQFRYDFSWQFLCEKSIFALFFSRFLSFFLAFYFHFSLFLFIFSFVDFLMFFIFSFFPKKKFLLFFF